MYCPCFFGSSSELHKMTLKPAWKQVSSIPRMISAKYKFELFGIINPIVWVRLFFRLRATALGTCFTSAMASSTRARAASPTKRVALTTCDTAVADTPAWRSMSLKVIMGRASPSAGDRCRAPPRE